MPAANPGCRDSIVAAAKQTNVKLVTEMRNTLGNRVGEFFSKNGVQATIQESVAQETSKVTSRFGIDAMVEQAGKNLLQAPPSAFASSTLGKVGFLTPSSNTHATNECASAMHIFIT